MAEDIGTRNARAVNRVLKDLLSTKSEQESLSSALENVRDAFGWSYGSFWRRDREREELVFAQESGSVSDAFQDVTRAASFKKGVGVSGRTWERGDIMVVEDLGKVDDCVRAPVALEAGVKSGVCLPIHVEGELVGTMDFFALEKVDLHEESREALRNVAHLVSSSLERIQDRDRQVELAANAEAVNEVLRVLGTADTEEDAVKGALDAVRSAFGWDYGSFWALDKESRTMRFAIESGSVSEEFRRVTREASFAHGVGVSGRTWSGRELLVVEDLGRVTDCVRAPVASKAGVKSGVCFPILVKDDVVGTMDFFSLERLTLSEERQESLRRVGHLVSSSIERLRQRDQFIASLEEMARELSLVSGNLKETTANQSSSAQELATSVSQVTTTLSELRQASADALEKAEAVIVQAQHSVETSAEGSKAVEAAVESMREITGSVEEISDRVQTLSEQTAQIGDIIASVNEIAAQSKLLALNAAIEAARAGEHGKGFAVVATEIRSLSDQSKDATGQVRDILGEIQGGTSQAVDSARDGTVRVAAGMELAERSGRNISELGETIERSAESARLIANAARQQNAGIEQVADAMASIREVSQNTVAVVRQTDDAAEKLVNLSAKIANLMQEFGNGKDAGAGH